VLDTAGIVREAMLRRLTSSRLVSPGKQILCNVIPTVRTYRKIITAVIYFTDQIPTGRLSRVEADDGHHDDCDKKHRSVCGKPVDQQQKGQESQKAKKHKWTNLDGKRVRR
jgi:hypothetical protein